MSIAQRNVEKYFAVVGVLEFLDQSLEVLEHYIPRFFQVRLRIVLRLSERTKRALSFTCQMCLCTKPRAHKCDTKCHFNKGTWSLVTNRDGETGGLLSWVSGVPCFCSIHSAQLPRRKPGKAVAELKQKAKLTQLKCPPFTTQGHGPRCCSHTPI